MIPYSIVPAKFHHIPDLVGALRFDDWDEITCFGVRPFVAVRQSFKSSHVRRTVLVEGEVAAMWGLAGVMLGTGYPWLLTGKAIERIPVSFVREARAEVREMLEHCNRLEGVVIDRYSRAKRFLTVLGFTLGEPFSMKDNLVRHYWMDI